MRSSQAVRYANKATSVEITSCIEDFIKELGWEISVSHARDLQNAEREAIWQIFETNMSVFYTESSFGWDPPSKRKELFDLLSRFILVHDEANHTFIGFVMFRFEYEDGEDLLYCYDLQISKVRQRSGLGSILIQSLARIGAAWKMEKIMLTVLKANTSAKKFYDANGFVLDPCSPGYVPEDEVVDYMILSRNIS